MTTEEHDDGEVGYDLVMPFITVASKGGPHDDQAYVAGWEMGKLDEVLRTEPWPYETTIRTDNVPQAELLAMKHEGQIQHRPDAIYGTEWSHVRFFRNAHIDG